MEQFRVNQEKGITLSVLVITVIVLLIIAGVTFLALTGENGIIESIKKSKENHMISLEKEQVSLAYFNCSISNKQIHGVTARQLENALEEGNNDITVTQISNYLNVIFTSTGHKYLVDENGNVEMDTGDQEYETKKSEINNEMVNQENLISYSDGLKTLVNPDRGLYASAYIVISDSTDIFSVDIDSICRNAIRNNQQLLHLRFNIGKLSGNVNSDGKDRDFSNQQLKSLNSIFDKIRSYNLNAVVRFAYDFDGNTNKEPKSFNTIEKHIQQLSSVFETNKDVITCVEAGFIGPWGEMHDGGEFEQDDYYKKLVEELLDNTPYSMSVNVRTPYHYKLVFGELNNSSKNKYRVGIFNDGYFGSETDLGTFKNDVTRDIFVNWMKEQGKHTYYGGEATKYSTSSSLYNSEDEQWSESSFVISEMPQTHTTYLNGSFNESILNDKWKVQNYSNSSSEYNNQTAYKYIVDHLGYRLVLRDSQISENVKQGEICGVKLKIENVGFNNIIRNQKVSVILSKDSQYYEAQLYIDATSLECGKNNNLDFYFYVPSGIEVGNWNIYLKIASNDNSDYAIKFANTNIWNSNLDANLIGKVNIIENNSAENTNIKQAFVKLAKEGTYGMVSEKQEENYEAPKIPVSFSYYIAQNMSLVETRNVNISLGTTINFKDDSLLDSLGLSIPEGYKFKFAQCYAITGDWSGYDSITIPSETSAASYSFEVHLDLDGSVFAELNYYLSSDSSLIKSETIVVILGTTIDFTDESCLTSLGINMPSDHTFKFAQCPAITGDWGGYNSITIPKETNDSKYVFQIHMN